MGAKPSLREKIKHGPIKGKDVRLRLTIARD